MPPSSALQRSIFVRAQNASLRNVHQTLAAVRGLVDRDALDSATDERGGRAKGQVARRGIIGMHFPREPVMGIILGFGSLTMSSPHSSLISVNPSFPLIPLPTSHNSGASDETAEVQEELDPIEDDSSHAAVREEALVRGSMRIIPKQFVRLQQVAPLIGLIPPQSGTEDESNLVEFKVSPRTTDFKSKPLGRHGPAAEVFEGFC